MLRAGCAHMRKAFDIENINLDDLIATALDDPKAVGSEIKAFHGINFADLQTAYQQFCKNEKVGDPVVDLGEVIEFFNKAAADLPDHTKLKGLKLPGVSVVLDRKGERFADVFEENQRRIWVSLADIPEQVQKAFVAAEDRRFYQHQGRRRARPHPRLHRQSRAVGPAAGRLDHHPAGREEPAGRRGRDLRAQDPRDDRGVAGREHAEQGGNSRALSQFRLISAAAPGASRWRRAAISASRRRSSRWRRARMLAGLTKGPNFFNPDRHPERAQERLAYVLSRMQEDGARRRRAAAGRGLPALPTIVALRAAAPRHRLPFRRSGGREAKSVDGIEAITANSYTVHSTINRHCSGRSEATLQEGLSRYERSTGRVQFGGPEANLAKAVPARRSGRASAGDKRPAWQQALANAQLPLYDVHWTPAVMLEKPSGKKGEAWRVGL